MELDNLLNDLISQTGGLNAKQKNGPLSEKMIEIFRRLRKGWLIVLLIMAICLVLAKLLYVPLSKIHSTTTKMGVMFNKEREANKQGNIANEIVGRITGWTTTTNKYDEIAILTSHVVVGNMLQQTGKWDSVYKHRIQEVGHHISKEDSIQFVTAYVEEFLKGIDVTYTQTKDDIKTSLITLSMGGKTDECGPLLVGLVNSYNQFTRDYNIKLYDNTLHFLDKCIDKLKYDLDKIDNQDRAFREGNLIVDISQQTGEYINIDRRMEDDLRNINLQIQLLNIIRSYMVDMGKEYKVVPANTGIDDDQINRIVIQFNDLVMRRSNFLTSMGEDAMRVQTITNQIEDQRQALIISIDKLTQSFNIRKVKLEKDLKESNARLEKMPNKRITLDQIKRERDIKTPLYKLLQEKYTETLIAKSAEQDQARIITYPYMEETKLFASPLKLYLFGFILGILFSILYLWQIKLPPRQLTLEEALRQCELPCWSVIPKTIKVYYFQIALQALMSRIRMSGSKIIAITCSYKEEEHDGLAEKLAKLMEQQGEKHQFIKWNPESPQLLSKYIEQYDKSNGYLIADCGSYHSNPEMPLISQLSDITLWNVVMSVSQLKSIDFINYAIKEGLVKKGALVLTDARIDKNNSVNFGNFDYKNTKFSFAKFFSSDPSSNDNVQKNTVSKSSLVDKSDINLSSLEMSNMDLDETNDPKPIPTYSAKNKSLRNLLKKWWWLLLMLIVIPLGFWGGYYLTKITGEPKSNEKMVVKTKEKEIITQNLPKNFVEKKQVPPVKESVIDVKTDAPKTLDNTKTNVVKPEQNNKVDVHEKYAAMDKRVQYGAYKIVGLDKEVQTRDGDNLESFSKRYLGPGMSCYIEVFNGIKADTPLKTGQTLKIPKLVKKIKQTNN